VQALALAVEDHGQFKLGLVERLAAASRDVSGRCG
jgi:hypothetical protein